MLNDTKENTMSLLEQAFDFNVRVYYEDTDAGAVVFYPNYLKFTERARSEWMRELGMNQSALIKQDLAYVVREVHSHYHSSAFFDDFLLVKSKIIKLRKTMISFEQKIYRDEELIHTSYCDVVLVNIKTKKIKPWQYGFDLLNITLS